MKQNKKSRLALYAINFCEYSGIVAYDIIMIHLFVYLRFCCLLTGKMTFNRKSLLTCAMLCFYLINRNSWTSWWPLYTVLLPILFVVLFQMKRNRQVRNSFKLFILLMKKRQNHVQICFIVGLVFLLDFFG